MRMPLTLRAVLLTVTIAALIGVVLGGLSGFTAGYVILVCESSLPAASAVLGAAGGLFLGVGLAVFAVTVALVGQFLRRRADNESETSPSDQE